MESDQMSNRKLSHLSGENSLTMCHSITQRPQMFCEKKGKSARASKAFARASIAYARASMKPPQPAFALLAVGECSEWANWGIRIDSERPRPSKNWIFVSCPTGSCLRSHKDFLDGWAGVRLGGYGGSDVAMEARAYLPRPEWCQTSPDGPKMSPNVPKYNVIFQNVSKNISFAFDLPERTVIRYSKCPIHSNNTISLVLTVLLEVDPAMKYSVFSELNGEKIIFNGVQSRRFYTMKLCTLWII